MTLRTTVPIYSKEYKSKLSQKTIHFCLYFSPVSRRQKYGDLKRGYDFQQLQCSVDALKLSNEKLKTENEQLEEAVREQIARNHELSESKERHRRENEELRQWGRNEMENNLDFGEIQV